MSSTKMNMKEQLAHLKDLTERFNMLHEAQTVQLRNYPLLIPNIKSAEVKINTDFHIVTFHCEEDKKFRLTKKAKAMIGNILLWSRTVVWSDTTLEIFVGDRMIYDSREERSDD